MRRDWGVEERQVSILKSAATAVLCVLLFAVPVQAVAIGGAGSLSAMDGQAGPAANLDCLDESRGEITSRLGSLAGRTMAILPESVQSRVVGEQLSIVIGGSTHFAATVSEAGTVQRVRAGQAEDPSVVVRTDCQTVADIEDAESPSAALERSISQGRITLDGTSATADATVSYGSKGVQTYHIVQSSETGDIEDGTEGFTNGLVYD